MGGSRWLRPEVYPLFAAVGVAVGICGFQLARNICFNPEVRVTKQNRAAGVLDNFSEGEKYSEHGLRKLVRNSWVHSKVKRISVAVCDRSSCCVLNLLNSDAAMNSCATRQGNGENNRIPLCPLIAPEIDRIPVAF
ncbi:hypothetical protein D5086_023364 [Populus alba]|uniref:Uncharacterized protein n=1 Tax=Populus alba TaxID=43335 RepID=A0ACC4B9I3_POPAL